MPKQNGSSSRIVHDQEYSFRSPSGDDQTEQEGRKDPDKMNGGPVLFRHFVTPLNSCLLYCMLCYCPEWPGVQQSSSSFVRAIK